MPPTYQRLGLLNGAGLQIDDGLVVDVEFPASQRLPQFVGHLPPGHRGVIELIGEISELTPVLLGGIHGLVGALHEFGDIGAVVREQANADAGRQVHDFIVDLERLGECVQDGLGGKVDPLAMVHVGHHDRELVATEPGHRIGLPDAADNPPRHIDQQAVAGQVTDGVVDLLEAVQVDEEQGQDVSRPPRALDVLFQPIPEQLPVGQAGQIVVVGLPPDFVLVALAFADIREQTDAPQNPALVVAHSVDTEPFGEEFAILAAVDDFALPATRVQQALPEFMVERLVMMAALQEVRVPSQNVFQRVASQFGKSRIDGDDTVIGVGQ